MTPEQLQKLNRIKLEIRHKYYSDVDLPSPTEHTPDDTDSYVEWEVDHYGDEENTTVVNIDEDTIVIVRKWELYGIQICLIHKGIIQFVEEFNLTTHNV